MQSPGRNVKCCSLLLSASVLLLAWAPAKGASGQAGRSVDKPNILLIISDDQGYADLNPGPLGRTADVKVPNIDRLVSGGAQFTNAYATSPICSPSRAGICTGRYQQRWGNYYYAQGGLPAEEKTLAEILKDEGYATGYFGKVHFGPPIHGPEAEYFPTNIGYDTFYGYLNHTIHYLKHKREYVEGQDPRMHHRFGKGPMWIGKEQHDQEGFTTELFAERARQFIKENHDRPLLATIAFNALHTWIDQLPEKYVAEHNLHPLKEWAPGDDPSNWYSYATHPDHPEGRRWYLAQLMYLDREIGRILDLLESMGLREKTMIIYTSDNGGSPSTWAINVPLSGFKYSLAEGGIRVPFIVNWPGHIPAGTYNAMISGLDIVPTVAAAVGAPPRGDWDGKNLLPLLQRKAPDKAHHWHVWDTGREWAVREGDWKLRVNIDPEKNEQTSRTYNIRIPTGVQLYNLREDIGERVNLVDRHPDVVELLRTRYARWRAEMK